MEKNVSIILPVYNAYDGLFRCLKSIIGQTFKNFEIICINSASSDLSLDVLESFSKKESRIKIINKINEGAGAALNTGINASEGEYLLLAEPFDFYHKKTLENLYKLARQSEADIVKSPYTKFIDVESKIKGKYELLDSVKWNKRCKIPNWFFRINESPSFLSFHPAIFATLYKKSFLNNSSIRFVETRGQNFPTNSFIDFPFYIETMLLAKKIVYTDNIYSYHRKAEFDFQNLEECISPFDRIEEVFEILAVQKIKDKNVISNVYKRALKLINLVFERLDEENKFDVKSMPYEIQLRIEKVISLMDEDIINSSLFIDDFERRFFNLLAPDKLIQKGF